MNKIISSLFAAIIILVVFSSEASADYTVTEYRSEESEDFLWDCLSKYSPSDYVTAGIIGYFDRESCFRSDATAGWGRALSCTGVDHCKMFTDQIDEGLEDGSTREEFMHVCRYQYGGYGLGQWCLTGMMEHFYDFAQEWGTSISDAEMQCAFTVADIQERYEDLWNMLLEVDNATEAGILVGKWYDGTSSGYGYIGQLAQEYYDKHVGGQKNATA